MDGGRIDKLFCLNYIEFAREAIPFFSENGLALSGSENLRSRVAW